MSDKANAKARLFFSFCAGNRSTATSEIAASAKTARVYSPISTSYPIAITLWQRMARIKKKSTSDIKLFKGATSAYMSGTPIADWIR
jgi:hypothetical protein